MDLKEFERQVLAGKITDFQPYFESENCSDNHHRKALCIEYGIAQEFYPKWAKSNNQYIYDTWIHQILARHGYCLDILSKSDDYKVLEAVLEYNINYALDMDNIIMNDYRQLIYEALMDTQNIPKKVLKKYFETKNDNNDDTVLKLKYKAMQIVPTTIEKTMSPVQLFVMRNPLWTLNLTGYQIEQVINSSTGVLELEKILKQRS